MPFSVPYAYSLCSAISFNVLKGGLYWVVAIDAMRFPTNTPGISNVHGD